MTETLLDLNKLAADYAEAAEAVTRRIVVCAGTGCMANGSLKVVDALVDAIGAAGLEVITELIPCGEREGADRTQRMCPSRAVRASARWARW